MLRALLNALLAFTTLTTILCLRLLFVIRATHATPAMSAKGKASFRKADEKVSIAVFLGSGGHTAEMIRMLSALDFQRYNRRLYLIGQGDEMSEDKALALENLIGSGDFVIFRIPRARKVHQSYLTSPFTTLYSLVYCLWYITIRPTSSPLGSRRAFADVILLNGPGSCVPIVLSAFLPRVLGLSSPKLVYVESFARTQRLSASAVLVRPFVDRFFVQWDSLRKALLKKEGSIADQSQRVVRMKARVEYEGWLV